MAELRLLRGEIAIVDDDILPIVSQHVWHRHSQGYVVRMTGPRHDRKAHWLHRIVVNAPEGIKVDHRNRNKLDNQRHNLRLATDPQNAFNKAKKHNSSSPYKGVWFKAARKRFKAGWEAWIKKRYIGFFQTAEEAAIAYNREAVKLFGEFALLNEVPAWQGNG